MSGRKKPVQPFTFGDPKEKGPPEKTVPLYHSRPLHSASTNLLCAPSESVTKSYRPTVFLRRIRYKTDIGHSLCALMKVHAKTPRKSKASSRIRRLRRTSRTVLKGSSHETKRVIQSHDEFKKDVLKPLRVNGRVFI